MRTRLSAIVATISVACSGLIILLFGDGGLERAGAAAQGEATIAEARGVVAAGDGRWVEVSVLVDTSLAEPEEVLSEIAPEASTSPGVTAAFALLRRWAPQDTPVEVSYNPEWDLFISARNAMGWSIQQWNSVPGSTFRFSQGPDTDVFASSLLCDSFFADGVNSVMFDYLLPDGTLAVTCSLTDGSLGGIPRAVEFDIQLNAATDWSDAASTPGWAYDLRSTMLHELGHALGLDHTNSSGAVMLPSIGAGEQMRTITVDDRNGVLALYPGGATGPTGTPTSAPTAAVPTPGAATPPNQALNIRQFVGMLARDFAPAPPPPPPPPTPTPPPPAAVTFGAGIWLVGVDIPAGTYRTRINAEACYWERLRGLGGTLDEIIANGFSDHTQIVTLLPTDLAFSTDEDCGTWTSDLSPITSSPTADFSDGMYIVGTDIAPGLWRADGGDGCYWARLSGFSGRLQDIIANDFEPPAALVQIAPGDDGFETNECGVWRKVG